MAKAMRKTAKKLRSFSLYFLGGIFVLISSLFIRGLWSGNQMSIASFEKEIRKVFAATADATCWESGSAPIGDDSTGGGDSDPGGGGDSCDDNGGGCGDSGSY